MSARIQMEDLSRFFIRTGKNGRREVDILKIALFSIFAVFAATWIHELGHVIALRLIGCQPYAPSIFFMFGVTEYSCETHALTPQEWAFAALAGPIFAFIVGYLLWKYHKDSIVRLFALNLFFYGTIPNLIWQVPGTDAYFAVTHGFDPLTMTIISFTMFVLINYLVAREIMELE